MPIVRSSQILYEHCIRRHRMSTAYLVLLILAIIYVPIWIWAWRCPESASRWHLQKYGPCIMIRTHLGIKAMDRLSGHRRFWSAFGFMSKVVSAILFLMMMYMLIVAVIALPTTLTSGSSIGIEYALAIPGFNPIMPLSYGIVALLIAMVVHEMAHGIQSRANGIDVESSGLLYGVVPLGAFVEPNEEQLSKAPRKAQTDVYAAGITINTVVAVVSILLMASACGLVTSEYGDNAGAFYIDDRSPAYEAGIPASALILGIAEYNDGIEGGYVDVTAETRGNAAYLNYEFDPLKQYSIRYIYHDEVKETGPIHMGAYIKALTKGGPADSAGIGAGSFIVSINETLIGNPIAFNDFMSGTSPGDVVEMKICDADGSSIRSYTVQLGSKGSIGFMGIVSTTGGIQFTTPDLMLDYAVNPFCNAEGAYGHVKSFFSYLSGPFNGMDPIPNEIQWWYDAPGGNVFWVTITMLYWLFWLDILLAISNALPTRILDGGYIFSGGLSWLLERTGMRDAERREKIVENISGSVSTITLFLFMIVIMAMVV